MRQEKKRSLELDVSGGIEASYHAMSGWILAKVRMRFFSVVLLFALCQIVGTMCMVPDLSLANDETQLAKGMNPPVHRIVADLIDSGIEIHCLRDLTRGGLASVLNELAVAAKVGITADEVAIPVSEPVRGACELLGLDPLYVANEGRFVAMVPAQQAKTAKAVMRRHTAANQAAHIGMVTDRDPPLVVLRTVIGTHRVLDLLSGEQLPRIC